MKEWREEKITAAVGGGEVVHVRVWRLDSWRAPPEVLLSERGESEEREKEKEKHQREREGETQNFLKVYFVSGQM